jgi:hypothetical protein
MRHRKAIQDCVAFAQFCRYHDMDPVKAADLITLADRAYHAGVRACNVPNRPRDLKPLEAFEDLAGSLGFAADWSGLKPHLVQNGVTCHLPEI